MLKKSELILFSIVFFIVALWCVVAFSNAYAVDKEFRRCAGCHSIEKDKKGGMGPNLYGVYGSPAGQVKGYYYSKWLKESNITWNRETLRAWLSDRKTREEYFGKKVFKTKMMWTGIKKEKDMKEILDYLESKRLMY